MNLLSCPRCGCEDTSIAKDLDLCFIAYCKECLYHGQLEQTAKEAENSWNNLNSETRGD